jgi:DNA topoisomerase VI subunit B
MDFFSEKELVTQTGHDISQWQLVIVKELVDNALDACEEADIAPAITVTADPCSITISDNGPGLPETTLKGALDFTVRVSNREAYVAPDRGAQGNALKTLLPMPHVIDRDKGRFIVEAHGKRHVIRCGAHPISQRPHIQDEVTEKCKNLHARQALSGTSVRLEWGPRQDDDGETVWPFDELLPCHLRFAASFRELVQGFAVFNPHATITLDWFGQRTTWKATDPTWQKWKPSRPTSAHWYQLPHLERLIGAYITHDRDAGKDRLVSDFLSEFDGLTGSQKRAKVLAETDLKRVKLSELVTGDNLDSDRIAGLLAAMQRHTRQVKSPTLGVIGKDQFRARLLAMGVKPESFRYCCKVAKCKKSQTDPADKASFLPWVMESAFGYLGDQAQDHRQIYTGVNWSAAIGNPFRSFGSTGEGLETVLAKMRVTREERVVFILHLACPRVEYLDRGKSALVIGVAV